MSDSSIPPIQNREQGKNLTFDQLQALATGVLADAHSVEYSDDALALRFTKEHDDLRYTAAHGEWRKWNGFRWVEDDTLHVFDQARTVSRDVAKQCEKGTISKSLISGRTVAAVENLARSDRRHAMTVDQWDCDIWLLNTPGGSVDLTTGEARRCNPQDHCTKATAAAPGGECPKWLAFLDTVTAGDVELQAFLQRVCGYCLSGSTRDHALFFLYGTGANGKSVFTSTLSGIFESYARTASIESFTSTQTDHHPTDLASLAGARLVISTETEDGRRWAESKLKSLTGGDRIAARFMRQDFFEFTPQFKLMIAGNHKPGLRSVDQAMRRRMNLIPFSVTIPAEARNPRLAEELRVEWPGILQWMITGCLVWLRDGLSPPKIVRDATDIYMTAEDALGTWIEEKCDEDAKTWTTTNALFESWKEWAEDAGEYVGSQKRFSQNLESRSFEPRRTNKTRGFLGIQIRGNLL
jgi:putative DNA primase/helicase